MIKATRARQRCNQKVSAWNEYVDMSPDERAYWANKDAVWDDIRMQDPRLSRKRLAEYMAMDSQGPHQWARDYARRRYPDEYTGAEYYDYGNMPEIEFIEDFPDELADAPWRY